MDIDGVAIHYWHIPSKQNPGEHPLLLIHGWPGSVIEFIDLIPALTNPTDGLAGFDLIVPKIPGFGFSGKPAEPGWGTRRIASAFDALMVDVLGFGRYSVHGGDWGTILGARMARIHAEHIDRLHINMPFVPPPVGVIPPAEWAAVATAEYGYLAVQNFRPDVITMGAADSPVGLLAWILDKFDSWSDGGVEAHSMDVLLANAMFYWAPDSIVSATRLYREAELEPDETFGLPRIEVPTAVAHFPYEPFSSPREWVEVSTTSSVGRTSRLEVTFPPWNARKTW